jgi:hypothetical protein
MTFYSNLPLEQRRAQQLIDQFNSDEQLWRSLERNRRLRRRCLRQVSAKQRKQLDLLEVASKRPLQDCIGFFL